MAACEVERHTGADGLLHAAERFEPKRLNSVPPDPVPAKLITGERPDLTSEALSSMPHRCNFIRTPQNDQSEIEAVTRLTTGDGLIGFIIPSANVSPGRQYIAAPALSCTISRAGPGWLSRTERLCAGFRRSRLP